MKIPKNHVDISKVEIEEYLEKWKFKGGTINSFAKEIGIKRMQTITRFLNGTVDLGSKKLELIINYIRNNKL